MTVSSSFPFKGLFVRDSLNHGTHPHYSSPAVSRHFPAAAGLYESIFGASSVDPATTQL